MPLHFYQSEQDQTGQFVQPLPAILLAKKQNYKIAIDIRKQHLKVVLLNADLNDYVYLDFTQHFEASDFEDLQQFFLALKPDATADDIKKFYDALDQALTFIQSKQSFDKGIIYEPKTVSSEQCLLVVPNSFSKSHQFDQAHTLAVDTHQFEADFVTDALYQSLIAVHTQGMLEYATTVGVFHAHGQPPYICAPMPTRPISGLESPENQTRYSLYTPSDYTNFFEIQENFTRKFVTIAEFVKANASEIRKTAKYLEDKMLKSTDEELGVRSRTETMFSQLTLSQESSVDSENMRKRTNTVVHMTGRPLNAKAELMYPHQVIVGCMMDQLGIRSDTTDQDLIKAIELAPMTSLFHNWIHHDFLAVAEERFQLEQTGYRPVLLHKSAYEGRPLAVIVCQDEDKQYHIYSCHLTQDHIQTILTNDADSISSTAFFSVFENLLNQDSKIWSRHDVTDDFLNVLHRVLDQWQKIKKQVELGVKETCRALRNDPKVQKMLGREQGFFGSENPEDCEADPLQKSTRGRRLFNKVFGRK